MELMSFMGCMGLVGFLGESALCFSAIRCDMMKGEVRRSFKFNDLLLAVILHCDDFSIRVELLCVVL